MVNITELPFLFYFMIQNTKWRVENLLLFCGYFMRFKVDTIEKCKCHDVASVPPSPSVFLRLP